MNACKHLKPTNVTTLVYPGFPTDLGQPMSVLLTQAEGISKLLKFQASAMMKSLKMMLKHFPLAMNSYSDLKYIKHLKKQYCSLTSTT